METFPLSNHIHSSIEDGSYYHYQPSMPLDILADEQLPLLISAKDATDFRGGTVGDMAPVHVSKRMQGTSYDLSGMKHDAVKPDPNCFSPQFFGRVNVIEALQKFWQKKLADGDRRDDSIISYATEPVASPPYVCYVTLPGGCSFGSLHECSDRAEARRSAAHIALVNSIYNELPSRKITERFIEDALQEAAAVPAKSDDHLAGIAAYQLVLETVQGQTMLDYTALANRLLVMHWSRTLQSMSRRSATRQDVLKAAVTTPWFSEDYRSEMALEWMAIERREPGRIDVELKSATTELETARRNGRELSFPRLKRDVLRLASSQVSSDALYP